MELIEVRCPMCGRYVCSVPPATPVRVYCNRCNLKAEMRSAPAVYMQSRQS